MLNACEIWSIDSYESIVKNPFLFFQLWIANDRMTPPRTAKSLVAFYIGICVIAVAGGVATCK